jgi:hypothetical protein
MKDIAQQKPIGVINGINQKVFSFRIKLLVLFLDKGNLVFKLQKTSFRGLR